MSTFYFFLINPTGTSGSSLAPIWQQSGTLLLAVIMDLPAALWMNCKSEFGVYKYNK